MDLIKPDHSDLEVVPNDGNAPEPLPDKANGIGVVSLPGAKNVVTWNRETDNYEVWADDNVDRVKERIKDLNGDGYGPDPKRQSTRRICGFQCSRRTLYGVIAVGLLIVVAAAVGGGVGRALAEQRKDSDPDQTAPDNSTTTPSNSTYNATLAAPLSVSASMTITTTTIIKPTQTAYRDCPSSNDTLYQIQQGSSEPM